MTYADHCRRLFHEVTLELEDLYLLKSYQIADLRERAPGPELSAVLHEHPALGRFFVNKCPEMATTLDRVCQTHGPAKDKHELTASVDSLLWEIGEMLVYSKYPEVYDERVDLGWDAAGVARYAPLADRVVLEGGAGTGRLAFQVAALARSVFAMEPNSSLRRYARQMAATLGVRNVHSMDGFLHDIPVPDGFAEVLLTSNALGWQLEAELAELERVVGPGGHIVHLFRTLDEQHHNQLHPVLTAAPWSYRCERRVDGVQGKRAYVKQVTAPRGY